MTREEDRTNRPMPNSISDTLRRAADHIEAVGWYQGSWFATPQDHTASCCALGALVAVTAGDYRKLSRAYYDAADALRAKLGRGVAAWNDDPSRCVEDVLGALRGLADEMEEGRAHLPVAQEDHDGD